jgi:hypothetical protein
MPGATLVMRRSAPGAPTETVLGALATEAAPPLLATAPAPTATEPVATALVPMAMAFAPVEAAFMPMAIDPDCVACELVPMAIAFAPQPKDREGARPRNSADPARPRRRGDRVSAPGKAGAIQPVEDRPK